MHNKDLFFILNYFFFQPFNYISHLIGHEGPGSLLSALKERGWCNKLSSGYDNGIRGFAFYLIEADLTNDGMEHIDDILELVFQV